MKRTVASVLAGAVSVAILAGCGASTQTVEARTGERPGLTSAPEDSPEDYFVRAVDDAGLPSYVSASDALDLGWAICGAYDRNASTIQIVLTLTDGPKGLDPELAGAFIGASVVYLCPEHRAQADADMDEWSADGIS